MIDSTCFALIFARLTSVSLISDVEWEYFGMMVNSHGD